VHFVSWGALSHFSCKLGLKIFFNRPGGAGAPTASPWLRLCFHVCKQLRAFPELDRDQQHGRASVYPSDCAMTEADRPPTALRWRWRCCIVLMLVIGDKGAISDSVAQSMSCKRSQSERENKIAGRFIIPYQQEHCPDSSLSYGISRRSAWRDGGGHLALVYARIINGVRNDRGSNNYDENNNSVNSWAVEMYASAVIAFTRLYTWPWPLTSRL